MFLSCEWSVLFVVGFVDMHRLMAIKRGRSGSFLSCLFLEQQTNKHMSSNEKAGVKNDQNTTVRKLLYFQLCEVSEKDTLILIWKH